MDKIKHKNLEAYMVLEKWDLVFEPTTMPVNKLGRLKFLYLNHHPSIELTGAELARILHDQHFIKIVKYIARDDRGQMLPAQLRYVNLNYLKVEDLPKIIKKSEMK